MSRRLHNMFSRAAPFPRGHIAGFGISATGSTVTVDPGECRMGTSTYRSLYNGTLRVQINKLTSATWAAGEGQGGMASGLTVADNTWYHVFSIGHGRDIILDTDVEGANVVADAAVIAKGWHTHYRRIGSVRTTTGGGSPLKSTIQHGDLFVWIDPPAMSISASAQNYSGADQNIALDYVPLGLKVEALFNVSTTSLTGRALFRPGGTTIGAAPAATSSPMSNIEISVEAGFGVPSKTTFRMLTDTSQHVVYRVETDNSSDLFIQVDGWVDARGRWD